MDAERIGYEAAKLLDGIMRGDTEFGKSVLFDTIGVVERQSNDVLACDDKEIARKLRSIRDNAYNQVTVLDVERDVAVSRTLHNRRFKQIVGRTRAVDIIVFTRSKRKYEPDAPASVHCVSLACAF